MPDTVSLQITVDRSRVDELREKLAHGSGQKFFQSVEHHRQCLTCSEPKTAIVHARTKTSFGGLVGGRRAAFCVDFEAYPNVARLQA